MTTYFALRYVAGIPVDQRKHEFTLGRWATWIDADDARLLNPAQNLLEVVERQQASS